MFCGDLWEAGRVVERVITLTDGDPHLGVQVNAGASALMGARCFAGEWVPVVRAIQVARFANYRSFASRPRTVAIPNR